jgi:hypothetical protein
MKPLLAGFKSPLTTVIGTVTALLAVLKEYEVILVAPWIIPALIAMWAIVSRDANVSSQDSGIKPD